MYALAQRNQFTVIIKSALSYRFGHYLNEITCHSGHYLFTDFNIFEICKNYPSSILKFHRHRKDDPFRNTKLACGEQIESKAKWKHSEQQTLHVQHCRKGQRSYMIFNCDGELNFWEFLSREDWNTYSGSIDWASLQVLTTLLSVFLSERRTTAPSCYPLCPLWLGSDPLPVPQGLMSFSAILSRLLFFLLPLAFPCPLGSPRPQDICPPGLALF